MAFPFHLRIPRLGLLLALILAPGGGLMLRAQDSTASGSDDAASREPPSRDYSYKVADMLPKLDPLLNPPPPTLPNYAGALDVLNQALAVAEPGNSYDRIMLSLIKGQVLLQRAGTPDIIAAIEPLETVIAISKVYDYLQPRDSVPVYKYLAQAYMLKYDSDKDPALKRADLEQARQDMQDYFDRTSPPSADDCSLYGSILLTLATAGQNGGTGSVDIDLVKQAEQVARLGTERSLTVRPDLYEMIIFSRQSQEDWEAVTDLIEMRLAQDPNNSNNTKYWPLLPSFYLTLAQQAEESGNDVKADQYRIRAILAYNKARARGYFDKKDQQSWQHLMNLAVTYDAVGQTEKGAEALLTSLRNDKVPDDKLESTWSYAASFYQKMDKQKEAIDILKEASQKLPDSAAKFDRQISQAYLGMDDEKNAFDYAQKAAELGIPDSNASLWFMVAYLAYDLEHYDVASKAADKALSFPEAADLPNLKNLKDAIDQELKFEQQKSAKEAAASSAL